MNLESSPIHEILYVNFNQDFTCFVCGTESGFRVYNTDPFRLTSRRDFTEGGYGIIAMLFRTNITAVVGGGPTPSYQPNKVIIWDDRQSRVLAEFGFPSVVKAVRLRRDLIIVSVETKVYVYGFRNLNLLDSIETISNPKGLCSFAASGEKPALACLGMQRGHTLVVLYPRLYGDQHTAPPREKTLIIPAHGKSIAALALNHDGTLLATASDKGTMVRVYATSSGNQIYEFRRGADRADIHSLTFSLNGEWLLVASDKGTVHLFQLDTDNSSDEGSAAPNTTSSFKRFGRLLPSYFSSVWSFAQFHVPDYNCIAAFGQDTNTVIVLCASGSYYKARFDSEQGGEMVREKFFRFDDSSDALCGSVTGNSGSVANYPEMSNK